MLSSFVQKVKMMMGVGLFSFLGISLVFAAPVRFDVSVSPDPMKVSEFADVTIKAIDENDNIDTSYTEDIWIEVDGLDYTDPDLVLPGGGVGLFEASDQGMKIFSKGLSIKRAGTYTLTVADVYDTSLQGTVEFTVLTDNNGPAVSDITVTSPVSGGVEKSRRVDIIGNTSISNIPIEIFIDGASIQEGISDAQGSFTLSLSDLESGEHILKVNALDMDDQVVATSGEIPFSYAPDEDALDMNLSLDPGNQVFVDEKITFTVDTAERVTSVFLALGDDVDEVPMEKIEKGVFRKQDSFDDAGVYPIHVRLVVSGNSTDFKNAETITVSEETRKILTLAYTTDDKREQADLTWTYTGAIEFFKVKYGTNKDNLRLSVTTTTAEGTLPLADATIPYYVQVFPVDQDGIVNGDPSHIVTIEPLVVEVPICGDGKIGGAEQCDDGNVLNGDGCSSVCTIQKIVPICGDGKIGGAEQCDDGNVLNGDGCSSVCTREEKPVTPTCYPDGIDLKTKKVQGKYYIYRDPVPLAVEYTVYRSDHSVISTKEMSVVGKTKEPLFMYPFDLSSEVDKRAWYAVEATCPDNIQKPVGDVTVVKVGPKDTLIIIFLGALIVFMGWRMAKT